MTHEDAEAIARLCTACWRVGIAANAIETVKYADQKAENVRIRGVDPITMFDIDGVSIDVGRIWTESEGASGREICVVGPDMLKNLFGDAPADRAVGQEIRIDGRPYLVLGVLEPLGSIFGFSRDNVVYIPYSTYQKAYGGRRSIVAFIQVPEAEQLEVARGSGQNDYAKPSRPRDCRQLKTKVFRWKRRMCFSIFMDRRRQTSTS